MIEITKESFAQLVEQSTIPIAVDFWAPWCGPCRAFSPILEAASEELAGVISIGKVNVDDHPDLAVQFDVNTIPTLVLFKEGKAVDRSIGVLDANKLKAFLTGA